MKKLLVAALFAATSMGLFAQEDDGLGLVPAQVLTPLPFFDDFEKGFIVLRDGTELKGEVNIKQYEKKGKMDFTSDKGEKYSFAVESLLAIGLDLAVPQNMTSNLFYDWKGQKRNKTKEPERGFLILNDGTELLGKIQLDGKSSDSPIAGDDFFALETVLFVAKDGTETEYERKDIKAFGRILPWEFTPSSLFEKTGTEAFGKSKTKKTEGYAVMLNGDRIEGTMQLVVKNSMRSGSTPPEDRMMQSAEEREADRKAADVNRNSVVDEIWFTRDGKDDKIDMDDVFAFGKQGMTINDLTNNGDVKYPDEQLNFHQGTVKMKDGSTKSGLVAYFPSMSNLYGVYLADKIDSEVEIISRDDYESVNQEISLIEPFDSGYGAPASSSPTINGMIMTVTGKEYKGNIKLNEDNDWWVRSITFTDEDGVIKDFGGRTNLPLAYFTVDGQAYVQQRDVFLKTEGDPAPIALYPRPFHNSVGKMAFSMGVDLAAQEVTNQVARKGWGKTTYKRNKTYGSGPMQASTNYYMADNETVNMAAGAIKRAGMSMFDKEPEYKEGKMNFVNINTGEIAEPSKRNFESLLEGCYSYLTADKNTKKAISKYDDKQMIEYLNKAYSN